MKGPKDNDDSDGAIAEINIIPLVDVVLVLLIIFMVTTVFTRDSALDLELPKGRIAQKTDKPPTEIAVRVDTQNRVFVNNKLTAMKDLRARVQALHGGNKKTVIVVRGEKKVPYGHIMPVLDEISRTGIEVTLGVPQNTP